MRGDETHFLTGTDEHGQKIERMAAERGVGPAKYAEKVSDAYKATWNALEISNDDFIRTTDADHEKLVQQVWDRLIRAGAGYPGHSDSRVLCQPRKTLPG